MTLFPVATSHTLMHKSHPADSISPCSAHTVAVAGWVWPCSVTSGVLVVVWCPDEDDVIFLFFAERSLSSSASSSGLESGTREATTEPSTRVCECVCVCVCVCVCARYTNLGHQQSYMFNTQHDIIYIQHITIPADQIFRNESHDTEQNYKTYTQKITLHNANVHKGREWSWHTNRTFAKFCYAHTYINHHCV